MPHGIKGSKTYYPKGAVSTSNYIRRRSLVKNGKASWYAPLRSVSGAIEAAGLP